MTTTKDFSKLYKTIQKDISDALTDLQEMKIENKKGNQHLEQLKTQLTNIKNQFSSEINFLEVNSEWNKFTIAFFGETNAGKSTILEALRILLNEKKRREQIEQEDNAIRKLEREHSRGIETLISELENAYNSFGKITQNVRTDINELSNAVKEQDEKVEHLSKSLDNTKNTLKETEGILRRKMHPLRRMVKYGSVLVFSFITTVTMCSLFPDLVSIANTIIAYFMPR